MSFVSNLGHFTWSTANREPLLRNSWRERLHRYIGGIRENKKAKLIATGGIEDHMHIFASLPATMSIAQAASAMKANPSRWFMRTSRNAKPLTGKAVTRRSPSASQASRA